MQTLTEIALEKAHRGVFTHAEAAGWVGGSPDRQYSLLKRALAAGEVLRLHRGLYCLAAKSQARKPDPLVLAQRIYGPSYISLESALSYHGWIPEATYAVTSTSLARSCEVETPLGHFSYSRVPQATLYTELARVENDDGTSFLLASPLKALADYVYIHHCDWVSSHPLRESLRIEPGSLAELTPAGFDRLLANYASRRVRRFLQGLRKDVLP